LFNYDNTIMASLAYLAVTSFAFLGPTATAPSVKLQDEAALATLVRKRRDDAIEKRMFFDVVAGRFRIWELRPSASGWDRTA
jgi:hypothetical protein